MTREPFHITPLEDLPIPVVLLKRLERDWSPEGLDFPALDAQVQMWISLGGVVQARRWLGHAAGVLAEERLDGAALVDYARMVYRCGLADPSREHPAFTEAAVRLITSNGLAASGNELRYIGMVLAGSAARDRLAGVLASPDGIPRVRVGAVLGWAHHHAGAMAEWMERVQQAEATAGEDSDRRAAWAAIGGYVVEQRQTERVQAATGMDRAIIAITDRHAPLRQSALRAALAQAQDPALRLVLAQELAAVFAQLREPQQAADTLRSLAAQFGEEGAATLVAAADTYTRTAIDQQLRHRRDTWSDRRAMAPHLLDDLQHVLEQAQANGDADRIARIRDRIAQVRSSARPAMQGADE